MSEIMVRVFQRVSGVASSRSSIVALQAEKLLEQGWGLLRSRRFPVSMGDEPGWRKLLVAAAVSGWN